MVFHSVRLVSMNRPAVHIIAAVLILLIAGCSPKFTESLYKKNRATVDAIHEQYSRLNTQQPFSIEFNDKSYNFISLEIIKDTIRYIYPFRLDEPYLADTLNKYHYDTKAIYKLMADMKSIHCTWINRMNFYVNRKKETMIYMSVRQRKLDSWFMPEKYYTIAFFNQPQHFDAKGRITEAEGSEKVMKINSATYYRITDRICYAITEHFR